MTTRRKPSATLTKIMASLDEDTLRRTRDRMLIAGKISDTLKSKGISQRKFAEMLGKSESEISELLSGNRNFGMDTLSDISNCLKIEFLQISSIPTTRVSKTAAEMKVSKSRKPMIYDMSDLQMVPAAAMGWQTYQSSGCFSLAL